MEERKIVRAVAPWNPFAGSGQVHFKTKPCNAWRAVGGFTCPSHVPNRLLFGLLYRYGLPPVFRKKGEVRLCFMEPVAMNFDAFPYYMGYEIIPFLWDVWPMYDDKVVRWLRKYRVRTCIVTSSQAAQRLRERLPDVAFLYCLEGIDTADYPEGKPLEERTIDFYTYGRLQKSLYEWRREGIAMARGGDWSTLKRCLQDSKVVVALPQCDVLPERVGSQETLTQRYWECMLSRMVMVGRAPKELVDLLGYNPVIDICYENFPQQVADMVAHIARYQPLVDQNRTAALRLGDWTERMRRMRTFLEGQGYEVP